MYAAVSDGVSRSGDSGRTWSTIHFPSPGPGTAFVPSLLVDPNDSNVVYASVGATGGCIYTDHFLRKSTDAGKTWAVTAHSPITALEIDPKLAILYLGTSGSGVFRSIDGGASWTAFNDGLRAACSGSAATREVERSGGRE